MVEAKALVVDDDEPIRTLLTRVMESERLTVDTARNGAEAISRLDADGYGVVLLDLMMPVVDGFAVLRHMQEHFPEKLRRTIVATAAPHSEVEKRIKQPVFRVHFKPFDVHALIEDVRLLLQTA